MELHSYAKRKASKKWTNDQKRKLVETRISYDAMFSNKPSNSILPWKKVMNLAKLDDFNIFFVRKQWANMIAKYKQYKQTRLGHLSSRAIDEEMIQNITQEWEFFQPIHCFMARKTTNLHSYALTAKQEPLSLPSSPTQQEQERPLNSNSSTERINAFSSDTNEGAHQFPTTLNTDHDFYSKTVKRFSSYFADTSEENTQESTIVELTPFLAYGGEETEYDAVPNEQIFVDATAAVQTMETEMLTEEPQIKVEVQEVEEAIEMPPHELKNSPADAATIQKEPSVKTKLSERDKYYRHKRRLNRRLEQRFDSILNVFGQIVKAEYPSVDVSPLISATATAGGAVAAKLFSSGDEDLDSAEEEEQQVGTDGESNTINNANPHVE